MPRPPRVTSRRSQPTTRARTIRIPSPSRAGGPFSFRSPTPTRPGGTPSAPAAPAAPAAPQYDITNLPPDPSYDAAVAAAQRDRDMRLAAIAGERTRTLSDFGFTEGPGGVLAFDPNNPLSKAAVLKQTYNTRRRSTGQSMAAGGQLYFGSYQNAQDLINRNQVADEDAQAKALQAFLAGNTGQTTQTGVDYTNAVSQAAGDRVARFQSNPLYQPATADSMADLAPAAGPGAVPAAPVARPLTAAEIAAGLRRRSRTTGARIGRI